MRETALEELPLEQGDGLSIDVAACAWLEQEGQLAEALRHCRARSDWAAVAQLLERRGTQLVSAGEASEVLSAIELLPPERRGPAIEFVAGEAYHVVGDWDAALSAYGAAAGDARPLPTALAWRVARIHHFRGDLSLALECYGADDPTSWGGARQGDALRLAGGRPVAARGRRGV